MKHTKKLIPALGMLLLSACMLVTSTFAWFSMNDKVTATNMTVAAKGDQVYLQIKKTAFVDAEDNGKKLTNVDFKLTEGQSATELKPTNVMESLTDEYDFDSNTYIWVNAVGESAVNGAVNAQGLSKIDESALGAYRLTQTMYIRLDPTAGALTSNALKVSGVSFAAGQSVNNMAKCVSVMVVAGQYAQLWKYDGDKFVEKGGTRALSDATFDNSTTGLEVTVYVFFDGSNSLCTLENLAAAKTANENKFIVDVTFSCV